jgi:DNA-binding transcriptional ArsR family regulator
MRSDFMKEEYPFEKVAGVMKVIAHPERLRIVCHLEEKRMNVKELQEKTGLKQSITSQHLTSMANKGILAREREGNEVFYSIKKKDVFKLLSCMKGCCKE